MKHPVHTSEASYRKNTAWAIEKATGMLECTTDRQRQNGTMAFRDVELFETYTIHPRTGYARRKNSWNGIYQLNDKVEINYVSTAFTGTVSRSKRILLPGAYIDLAGLVIRGWNARRVTVTGITYKRQYVWDFAQTKRDALNIAKD